MSGGGREGGQVVQGQGREQVVGGGRQGPRTPRERCFLIDSDTSACGAGC